ncbi:MAG: hypothetical protein HY291_08090 [Planctomycetes bacterium]|nr:hypothetical protein [Planctomycetota bacterium]
MKNLLANLGMLGGLLLIVAGIVAILGSGLDPLYGSIGFAVAILGGALAWYGNRLGGGGEKAHKGPERAHQAPDKPAADKTRKGIDIGRRL